jgi:16S rRNA (guanine527-N7)-methyltransferase
MMAAARFRTPAAPPGWSTAHQAALLQALDRMGLHATPAQAAQLLAYAGLLLKWNRTYNLLGTDDADTVLENHLLDSIAVVPALARWLTGPDVHLVDVGSGAGLPGIPIAIMKPALPVTLVEPTGKKAAFLRQAVAQCRLDRVAVREARLEQLTESAIDPFHSSSGATVTPHFICRAFTSLERFARLCAPAAAAPGSLLLAMKSARVDEDIAELRTTAAPVDLLAVEKITVPGHSVRRNLVVLCPHPVADARALQGRAPESGRPREN